MSKVGAMMGLLAALAAGCGDALVGGACGEGYVERDGECVVERGPDASQVDAIPAHCDGGPCDCPSLDAGGAGDDDGGAGAGGGS